MAGRKLGAGEGGSKSKNDNCNCKQIATTQGSIGTKALTKSMHHNGLNFTACCVAPLVSRRNASAALVMAASAVSGVPMPLQQVLVVISRCATKEATADRPAPAAARVKASAAHWKAWRTRKAAAKSKAWPRRAADPKAGNRGGSRQTTRTLRIRRRGQAGLSWAQDEPDPKTRRRGGPPVAGALIGRGRLKTSGGFRTKASRGRPSPSCRRGRPARHPVGRHPAQGP